MIVCIKVVYEVDGQTLMHSKTCQIRRVFTHKTSAFGSQEEAVVPATRAVLFHYCFAVPPKALMLACMVKCCLFFSSLFSFCLARLFLVSHPVPPYQIAPIPCSGLWKFDYPVSFSAFFLLGFTP